VAIITSSKSISLDMDETYLGSAHLPDITAISPQSFSLIYPDDVKVHVEGSQFLFDEDGVLRDGFATKFTESRAGQVAFTIIGLSIGASIVQPWIEAGGYYGAIDQLLEGNDQIFGSDGDDRLVGLMGQDWITAGAGEDDIDGGDDADLLIGGLGSDTLTGGGGQDTFLGTRAEHDGDRILDFQNGDRIVVSDVLLADFGFSLSGSTLTLSTGETLTLDGFTGRLMSGVAAEGGVALSIAPSRQLQGDFNGDGRSDVFWREEGGAISNWLGQGYGGFVNNDSAAYLVGIPKEWRIAGSGDFNGDSRADVLFRHDDGRITNWLGLATGGIINNDLNAFAAVEANWSVAAVDDFDGDGRADILFRNVDGRVTNWLGQGDGGFVNNDATTLLNVPTDWQVAGSGDFNGDGYADILWRHQDGRVTNWTGRTDGGFSNNDGIALSYVPVEWKVVGTGDFNGDGLSDLLWRNIDGSLSNWLGRADGGFVNNDAITYTNGIPTSWHVADTGDYNGDGRSDILWRNDDGGLTTWVGRMDGGFENNDGNAFVTVSTNWQVQNDYPWV
jgi:hypothetical protein